MQRWLFFRLTVLQHYSRSSRLIYIHPEKGCSHIFLKAPSRFIADATFSCLVRNIFYSSQEMKVVVFLKLGSAVINMIVTFTSVPMKELYFKVSVLRFTCWLGGVAWEVCPVGGACPPLLSTTGMLGDVVLRWGLNESCQSTAFLFNTHTLLIPPLPFYRGKKRKTYVKRLLKTELVWNRATVASFTSPTRS